MPLTPQVTSNGYILRNDAGETLSEFRANYRRWVSIDATRFLRVVTRHQHGETTHEATHTAGRWSVLDNDYVVESYSDKHGNQLGSYTFDSCSPSRGWVFVNPEYRAGSSVYIVGEQKYYNDYDQWVRALYDSSLILDSGIVKREKKRAVFRPPIYEGLLSDDLPFFVAPASVVPDTDFNAFYEHLQRYPVHYETSARYPYGTN